MTFWDGTRWTTVVAIYCIVLGGIEQMLVGLAIALVALVVDVKKH
jgi:hypothetical protein